MVLAASAVFAAPASAQLIRYTTTGFFTGGGATPCTMAVLGTAATCRFDNGSGLQFNGASQQDVVNVGFSDFGTFQTFGSSPDQSYVGNQFTLVILQTSPTIESSRSIPGQITGSFSATEQGGSGGLLWAPTTPIFSVGAVNYRINNTIVTPPRAGGAMGDMQMISGNVTVVPEPGTYLLMASGLAGLGIMYRRRRNA